MTRDTQIEGMTSPIGGILDAFKGMGEAAVAALAVDKIIDYQEALATLGEHIERTAKMMGLSTDDVRRFNLPWR